MRQRFREGEREGGRERGLLLYDVGILGREMCKKHFWKFFSGL